MLAGTDLTYRINGRALVDDVTLAVAPGELVVLVGPNGAGKSTLLGLLAGDLRPTSGGVTIDGQPIDRIRPAGLARLRAVLPQQSTLQFAFTAAEVVELGCDPRADDTPTRVTDALADVDATDLAGRSYPTLSGGEQARVHLARILAQDTPVILLDEPTAHLDLGHQDRALRVVRKRADAGVAALVVLHDLNLAARWADRIAVLTGGRITACGSPADALTADTLSAAYQHPITVVEHPLGGGPLALPALT